MTALSTLTSRTPLAAWRQWQQIPSISCSSVYPLLFIVCLVLTCFYSNSSTSDNSDEEFFDAEMVGEWSQGVFASVRPTVVSVPVAEGDPSDVEEDEDYDEEDNTSGECVLLEGGRWGGGECGRGVG